MYIFFLLRRLFLLRFLLLYIVFQYRLCVDGINIKREKHVRVDEV